MEPWISVDKNSGTGNSDVKVTASSNEGADRSTTLTIKTSKSKTASVICSQLGKRQVFNCKEDVSNEPFLVKDESGGYEEYLVLKQ